MKIKLLARIAASLLLTGTLVFVLDSCKKDEVPVFGEPTIAVVADNSSPYPSDKVVFTIQVAATGKLKEVSANGVVIKTYTTDLLQDNFTYEYTVPATASLGPSAVTFTVTDKQATPKVATNPSTLTIQNPDFRGNPKVLFNFQTAAPNATVKAITRDIGGNPWENAYDIKQEEPDPVNASNKTLQADRKGAHEWYFQGGGGIFTEFVSKLSETEMQALVAGTRVLQMNLYFKEVKKTATVRATAGGADIPNVDLSWKFTDAKRAWNFDLQDSTKAIPIALAFGNKAKWDYNGGNPLGKKFFLVGSLSAANQWQTVTFSRRGSKTDPVSGKKFEDKPILQSSTALAYTDDATVGLDQIDYLNIIINNRVTSFKNLNGYLELPGDGNGWSDNVVASIADDHNTYYIDNIRIIDAKDYNKNPNK
jgi:hypothetical protein